MLLFSAGQMIDEVAGMRPFRSDHIGNRALLHTETFTRAIHKNSLNVSQGIFKTPEPDTIYSIIDSHTCAPCHSLYISSA
jgi:hypothetical protein